MFLKKTLIIFIVATLGCFALMAQSTAGDRSFAVLNLYNSAQMTARGLNFIPRFVNDVPTAITNPSTLNDSLNNKVSLTYTDLFAGAYQGALAFTHKFDKLNNFGNFGFGLQYINYGNFTQTESDGEVTGSFLVNDFMLTVGWGMQLEKNLYIGATFKPLFSQYESYSSFAIAFDLAATYVSNDKSWQAAFMIKNVGRQLVSFNNERDTLPFDMQIGVSKRFTHAPLILYIVADKLTKWNIRENDVLNPRDVTQIDGTVDEENDFSAFLDKGFRHLHFAVDIVPSDKFYISLGYSWRQHQEMKVDDAFSLAGFSYGLGIKYKKYTLNYARNEYHNYGSPNYLTLGYNF